MKNAIISIWNFYVEGFRNMTWGRQLWWLILLKVVILFVLLRGFFFKPTLSGKSDDERSTYVGAQLVQPQSENDIKYNN